VKKAWMFCRRCAAYMMRANMSLFDVLMFMSLVRLIDQHRYWDAAILLLVGAAIAVTLKGIAGKLLDEQVTVVNNIAPSPSFHTAGFGRRVQENLNGER